ncbi:Phosphatidylinositol 4-kinase pik1alpha (PI4-kinase)(PtdIns-4-kinase) [Dimargaris verticillata]|uniref:1-phosphatidylinositol 4-kinase n=1 Tax=Dimargaris verticillata TaxID=2761393 RepID=A0A9W8B686_9FUNG|nr:Phosphatidylinositol 4-kinase pik1alpha (PI4-kinase)(PtdIns-4-kinase) [Dimargaris verticillata]
MSSNSLLLRLFTSQFFNSWLAVSYLYKYPDSVGIQYYLCRELKKFPVEEIEFFLPQLCHLLLTRPNESVALEALLLELCEQSTHICLIMVWDLQSYISDFANQPNSPSFRLCRRLLNKCQEMIFCDDYYSDSDTGDADAVGPSRSFTQVTHLGAAGRPKPLSMYTIVADTPGLGAGADRLSPTAQFAKYRKRLSKWWRFKIKENAPPAMVGIGAVLAAVAHPTLSANAGQIALIQGRRSRLESSGFEGDSMAFAPGLAGSSPDESDPDTGHHSTESPVAIAKQRKPPAIPGSHTHLVGAQSLGNSGASSHHQPVLAKSRSDTTMVSDQYYRNTLHRPSSPPRPPVFDEVHTGRRLKGKPTPFERSQVQSAATPQSTRITLSRGAGVSFSDIEPSAPAPQPPLRSPRHLTHGSPLSVSSEDVTLRGHSVASRAIKAQSTIGDSMHRVRSQHDRGLLHHHHFQSELQFVIALTDISNRLVLVPRVDRQSSLKSELTLLNHNLPANVCLPLWCSAQDRAARHHKLVRISPADAVVLNSAERAPYLLMVEAVDTDQTIEELALIGKPNSAAGDLEKGKVGNGEQHTIASTSKPAHNHDLGLHLDEKVEGGMHNSDELPLMQRSLTADAVLSKYESIVHDLSTSSLFPVPRGAETASSSVSPSSPSASPTIEITNRDLSNTSSHGLETVSTDRRRIHSSVVMNRHKTLPATVVKESTPFVDIPSVDITDLHTLAQKARLNTTSKSPVSPIQSPLSPIPDSSNRLSQELCDNNTQHQREVHQRRKLSTADDFQERMRTAAVLLAQLEQQEAKKKSWYQRGTSSTTTAAAPMASLGTDGMGMMISGTSPGMAKGGPHLTSADLTTLPRTSGNTQGTDQIRVRIIHEMMALEEQRLRLMGPTSPPPPVSSSQAQQGSTTAVAIDGDVLEDKQLLLDDVKHKEDPSAPVFREDWSSKVERIRLSSPYGHLPGWQVFSVIVKTGADLRQEQFALQLIKEMQRIWKAENLDIWAQYYRILVLNDSSGLVETIKNTISIHSLKKEAYSRRQHNATLSTAASAGGGGAPNAATGADLAADVGTGTAVESGKDKASATAAPATTTATAGSTTVSTPAPPTTTTAPAAVAPAANPALPVFTLYDYYLLEYGAPNTEGFLKAQDNFMRSLVGYSLITYILQLKDRHNGNILVDKEGHLVHIDFGFMLTNSPGSMGFEMAPFKLSQEYLDVLGGVDSVKFAEFRELMIKGFMALRKYAENIILLVDMMQKDSKFPCFAYAHAVSALRDRFQTSLTEAQVHEFVDKMIMSSCCNVFTRLYDTFQYYSNGIL